MMKKIYYSALVLLPFLVLGACAEVDKSCDDPSSEVAEVSNIRVTMAETDSEIRAGSTRAVTGFVVNSPDDPTYSIDDKLGWTLDVKLYKSGSPYVDGQGQFTWNGSYWYSPSTIYIPHYLMQDVEAELAPASWSGGPIVTDQSVETVFIEQDILEQDGTPTYETAPAHFLHVRMRHAHSMIDFVLADVHAADITSVTVEADGQTYIPFKADVSQEEYLVILPLGISNPVIRVTTNDGADYRKELKIDNTEVNTCYYVKLVGLELVLEAITVSNWTYGEAVEGDYTSVTSYPTFRGPAGTSLTIYYNNDNDQTVRFNERGEATVKPVGRTIIRIENASGEYNFVPSLAIRTMVIDLNPYIALIP